MSELYTADASTGFRAPSTDAGYEAQFARTGMRTGSEDFFSEQLVEERAIVSTSRSP
jgi:hypothetical protein